VVSLLVSIENKIGKTLLAAVIRPRPDDQHEKFFVFFILNLSKIFGIG